MNNPFSSLMTEYSDQLFLTDKSGKTVFFPWGSRKQGYYIKNANLIRKAKSFYETSLSICFALLIVALSFFEKSFWGIVGSIFVCFSGWYLVYFLYASKIVKSLKPATVSYKELILSKYESEELENEELTEMRFPAQWNKPVHQTVNDPFLGIKRFWYRLSPGQLVLVYFFLGVGIIIVSTHFIKHEFGESPIDFVIAFVVSLIWGFAFFVGAKNIEGDKKDWWGFLNWKLPMILIVIACWSFAAFSLYKFFSMILV